MIVFQVGSISRSPPLRENGSANSSPEEGAEAELLVNGSAGGQSHPSGGVLWKLRKLMKKICSTHQFQNEQVSKGISFCGKRLKELCKRSFIKIF